MINALIWDSLQIHLGMVYKKTLKNFAFNMYIKQLCCINYLYNGKKNSDRGILSISFTSRETFTFKEACLTSFYLLWFRCTIVGSVQSVHDCTVSRSVFSRSKVIWTVFRGKKPFLLTGLIVFTEYYRSSNLIIKMNILYTSSGYCKLLTSKTKAV